MTERPFKQIIIVGAGPSGLLLALLLSKHGIPVLVLEASHELDQQPRAAHYGTPAIPEFRRAGILPTMRERGLVLSTLCWRLPDTFEWISGFDGRGVIDDVDGEDLRTHCFVLQDLDALMMEEARKYGAEVRFNHRVVGVGQDDGKAWVDVEILEEGGEEQSQKQVKEKTRFEADYVVGCDGAASVVRKSLFGDEFPGFTWDAQIVATNTYYDFEGKFNFHDANFIIHPENFYMAARITQDGLYRVTYGETPGLTREEYLARQPAKFEANLPGNPKPSEYRIVNFSPYKMHQRCAPKFRVGRVLLAADAAHLCNPWGGLGITGGFVDVGGLFDCLAGIWEGKADPEILELYSEKRIEKWKTVIDPISQENFRRVRDAEPHTRLQRDEFMQLLRKGKEDKGFLKDLLLGFNEVRYDFTQHYKASKKEDS